MTKAAVFTTTFDPKLLQWLNETAKTEKVTKRSILEDAIKKYKFEKKSREMEAGFRRAANDPEILEMAEWGIGDYLQTIDKLNS